MLCYSLLTGPLWGAIRDKTRKQFPDQVSVIISWVVHRL
jgi:hypothetical protein